MGAIVLDIMTGWTSTLYSEERSVVSKNKTHSYPNWVISGQRTSRLLKIRIMTYCQIV